MDPLTPLPEEVIRRVHQHPAQALSHEVVMDAIDLSMTLERNVLIYGIEGLFKLESEDATWRLPPSRAAWISAGTRVKATTIKPVRCISLFYRIDFAPQLTPGCQIFGVSPLVREMIKHSLTWSLERTADDVQADRFFLTLLDLCAAELESSDLFTLPKATSPELELALKYTLDNLSSPLQLADVAKKAAVSPRTLTRKLHAEIHMTWGQFLQQARMIRAMDYLAKGMSVIETALDIGYTNPAAFSTAFQKYTELTPTQYRAQFV